jgi:hypothetical protein
VTGIGVGASGSGTITFDTLPGVSQWSTLSVTGGSGDVENDAGLDTAMSSIAASTITTTLATQAGSSTNQLAYWRSDMKLGTQPTGNKMTLLMAKLANTSGGTIESLTASYTMGMPTVTPGEAIKGHRVYWSKTGAAGSWTAVGDYLLTTAGTTLAVNCDMAPLAWGNGENLYVVWADDNGAAGSDGDFTIDDVSFAKTTPAANILTFGLPGNPADIEGTDITLRVPVGTNVTALTPTFTMSYGASCTHGVTGDPIVSGVTLVNFTSPVHYIVRSAASVVTKDYTVTVVLVNPSGIINVNIDTATRTELVGPAGGLGQTWNQQPNLKTGSSLLDSVGIPTTVGFSTNASDVGTWGSPSLTLLTGGAFNWTANNPYTLTITGLTTGKKYDLDIASFHPNEDGSKVLCSTGNTTDTSSPQIADNGGANGNSSTWVQGTNYVRFQNVQPDSGNTITITIVGEDTSGNRRRAYLSGFQLVEVIPADPFTTWIETNYPSLSDKTPGGDPDGDGMSNQAEFAFGLDPSSGASVNPISVQLDKGTGTFSYTRTSNTGLIYKVWHSMNLADWDSTFATQGTATPNGGGVETVPVTLDSSLLSAPKLFLKVSAE